MRIAFLALATRHSCHRMQEKRQRRSSTRSAICYCHVLPQFTILDLPKFVTLLVLLIWLSAAKCTKKGHAANSSTTNSWDTFAQHEFARMKVTYITYLAVLDDTRVMGACGCGQTKWACVTKCNKIIPGISAEHDSYVAKRKLWCHAKRHHCWMGYTDTHGL